MSVLKAESLFSEVHALGRDRLFEHEVYRILELSGITPARHAFVRAGESLDDGALAALGSERVVLKIVSPEVVHKSDAGGVVFCDNDPVTVRQASDRLIERHAGHAVGALIVEFVEPEGRGLGRELFIGIRATREFGPVIAAGLGGTDTEYLSEAMRPGRAIARALTSDLTPGAFFEQFTGTAAYDLVAGKARGHERRIPDDELVRCFGAFIELANRVCVDRGDEPSLAELEVNPFVCRDRRLIPLDGRGRLGPAVSRPLPRPRSGVRRMLEAESIAVLGVSATNPKNFGRIILNNVVGAGFDRSAVRVIKDGADEIDGVECVASVSSLPEPVDLLVVAAGAAQLPTIVSECVESGKVGSAILIPGGAGETEGSEGIARELEASIARARQRPDGPVYLGPNSMGIQNRPGRYDTFFIQPEKLAKRWGTPHRGVAIVSQSGAFVVRQMSRFESLDPAFNITIGNQSDLTLSDFVSVIGQREDIHTIGVYAEGFNGLDGLDLFRAFRVATRAGKTVVLYKGGRTASGRDAAAGHTASLAGDYDVCEAGATQAGALIASDFREFSDLIEVATMTHATRMRGTRLGAITNAGCESVAIGDHTGERGSLTLASLSVATRTRLIEVLESHRLASLVNPRNPVDLTPMASEQAYLDAARVLLEADEIDALLVSCIPLSPNLATTEPELVGGSNLAHGLSRLRSEFNKPIVTAIDSGPRFQALKEALRQEGFAVMPTADQAVKICTRLSVHSESGG